MTDINKLSEQELIKLLDRHLLVGCSIFENKKLVHKIVNKINELKLSSNPIIDNLDILEIIIRERMAFHQNFLCNKYYTSRRIDQLEEKYRDLNRLIKDIKKLIQEVIENE